MLSALYTRWTKVDQSLHGTGNEANQTKGNDQTIERKDGATIYHVTHNAIGSPSWNWIEMSEKWSTRIWAYKSNTTIWIFQQFTINHQMEHKEAQSSTEKEMQEDKVICTV